MTCAHTQSSGLTSRACVRVSVCVHTWTLTAGADEETEIRRDGGGVWRQKDWAPLSKRHLFFSLRAKAAPHAALREREKFRQARTCCTRARARKNAPLSAGSSGAFFFGGDSNDCIVDFLPHPVTPTATSALTSARRPHRLCSPAWGQARVSIRQRVVKIVLSFFLPPPLFSS